MNAKQIIKAREDSLNKAINYHQQMMYNADGNIEIKPSMENMLETAELIYQYLIKTQE